MRCTRSAMATTQCNWQRRPPKGPKPQHTASSVVQKGPRRPNGPENRSRHNRPSMGRRVAARALEQWPAAPRGHRGGAARQLAAQRRGTLPVLAGPLTPLSVMSNFASTVRAPAFLDFEGSSANATKNKNVGARVDELHQLLPAGAGAPNACLRLLRLRFRFVLSGNENDARGNVRAARARPGPL